MEPKTCINMACRSTNTKQWISGWPLKSGDLARLCCVCGNTYKNSVYCVIFHEEESGWRECISCRKPIHCGCIASKQTYDVLDVGGVRCKTCDDKVGIHVQRHAVISKDGTDRKIGAIASSSNGPQLSQSDNAKRRARRLQKVSDGERQQIFGDLNSTLIPLFEKVLSSSDAKRQFMILPKIYAEAYFPQLLVSAVVPINVQDANGKSWKFHFRFWENKGTPMYVLLGFQSYIRAKGLQAGDIVIFCMMDTGNLIMGFEKIPHDGDTKEPPVLGKRPESSTQVPGSPCAPPEKRN